MGREYEPTVGQWYEDLENEETFQVLKVDEDKETVEIQHLDGDVEELDVDGWAELDLELTEEPEGWSGSKAEKDAEGTPHRRGAARLLEQRLRIEGAFSHLCVALSRYLPRME